MSNCSKNEDLNSKEVQASEISTLSEEVTSKRETVIESHARIRKVTHSFNEKSEWEDILKNIVITHLKADKRLD